MGKSPRITGLVLAGLLGAALLLELGLRLSEALGSSERSDERPKLPLYTAVDSPLVYALDPAHPDVNELGLRGPLPSVPKPEDVFRILLLGDSVAFGTGLERAQAFPARLRERLAGLEPPVEVIDASAEGYTPWNQLQYYLTRGAALEPDLVLVAFCMNDVANPRLHWIASAGAPLFEVPSDAIPNMRHDREYVETRLSEAYFGSSPEPFWRRSRLARAIQRRFAREHFRERVPTRITREDEVLEIGVLLDRESSEWEWLTRTYTRLRSAVEERGAQLAIALFPLAYQLDPDYPHLPQDSLTAWCREQGIANLDLLPTLRDLGKKRAFLLDEARGFYDVWHMTSGGHEASAERIARFLHEERLLSP